jgi:flavin-dependent dehydrogenase
VSGPEGVDVAVVGAGPAGATAALTLARSGARVVMLERAERRAFRVGEGLPPAARPLLQSLGLWERFLAAGHLPSHGNRSAWGLPELRDADFIFDPHGHGWHLDRAAFDAMLVSAAEEAGAGRGPATRVLGWEPGHGTLRMHDGRGPVVLQARRVLDCSGRSSVVALGRGARRILHDRLVAVAALHRPEREGDRDSTTLVEAVARGWWYTALLPGGLRVFAYLTDGDLLDRDACRDRAGWLRLLAQTDHVGRLHERFGYEPATGPMVVPAGSSRLCPVAGEGWVAAGDAAVSFDPLSSQGILTAMSTGRQAAAAVLASLEGDRDATARYEAHVEELDREYLERRAWYYAAERRWPESEFWRRRCPPA